jgi:cation diffusion facilitator family transporter
MDSGKNPLYHRGMAVTLVGMAVNVILMALKIWGGIWARSYALVADGIHSVSDLATDVVVLTAFKVGQEGEDERHPYGHGRVETLASFIIGVALAGAGIFIGWTAVERILAGSSKPPSLLAVFIAALSVAAKEMLYQYTTLVGKQLNSPALLSNAWHHRSDALSSIAVVVGTAAAQVRPDWAVLDGWAALVVAVMICRVGASFVWSATKEFIDTAPDKAVVEKIETCALDVDGVYNVHDIRARTSGGKVFVEIHVVVDGGMTVRDGHTIAKKVESCLLTEIDHLSKAIIHIDPYEPEDQA